MFVFSKILLAAGLFGSSPVLSPAGDIGQQEESQQVTKVQIVVPQSYVQRGDEADFVKWLVQEAQETFDEIEVKVQVRQVETATVTCKDKELQERVSEWLTGILSGAADPDPGDF